MAGDQRIAAVIGLPETHLTYHPEPARPDAIAAKGIWRVSAKRKTSNRPLSQRSYTREEALRREDT